MKKRLYNKYGAAIGDDVTDIQRIMQDATNLVTKYCLDNNLDLRDALSICKSEVDIMFAHVVLKEGMRIKKEEQETPLPKLHVTDYGEDVLRKLHEDIKKEIYENNTVTN